MNYKLNTADILITQLGDEGVAFNSRTNEYFSLNETSFKILKGIEKEVPVEQICRQLETEYNIAAPDCDRQVHQTVQLFIAKKLVLEQ